MKRLEIKFILEVDASTLDINTGKINKSTDNEIISTMIKALEPSNFVYNSKFCDNGLQTSVIIASKIAQSRITTEY